MQTDMSCGIINTKKNDKTEHRNTTRKEIIAMKSYRLYRCNYTVKNIEDIRPGICCERAAELDLLHDFNDWDEAYAALQTYRSSISMYMCCNGHTYFELEEYALESVTVNEHGRFISSDSIDYTEFEFRLKREQCVHGKSVTIEIGPFPTFVEAQNHANQWLIKDEDDDLCDWKLIF
jgi:hypothetical protein